MALHNLASPLSSAFASGTVTLAVPVLSHSNTIRQAKYYWRVFFFKIKMGKSDWKRVRVNALQSKALGSSAIVALLVGGQSPFIE